MNRPYDVNVVADYVIMQLTADDTSVSLINLKLQKLIYYIQGWFFGYMKEPMMNTKFEAWIHGPVSRPLYDRFRENKNLYSFIGYNDVIYREADKMIADEDKDFIKYILGNYAGFSGVELEQQSHQDMPWKKTREGLQPMEASTREIDDSLFVEYFGAKWNEIYGTTEG